MGKLIVFEGIDGSGKSTQLGLICERLKKEGLQFKKLTFPRYTEESSALLRMYLGGKFGSHPDDVNPYAASTFFAVDRFASYAEEWREYYKDGGILITDRYTTSNAIHQGSKLSEEKRDKFFKWLYEFEFELMELPKPDAVIYMNIPLETAVAQMRKREQEKNTTGDIHETDNEYLLRCCQCGSHAADVLGWHKLNCVNNGQMRPIEDIHNEIYEFLKSEVF